MNNIVQHLSLNEEYYTPHYIVETARKTMGSIDLDPASCELANDEIIMAKNFFSKKDNGLSKQWYGNVFLNPPGGKTKNKSNQQIWLKYAKEQLEIGNINQLIFVSFNIESLRICGDMLKDSLVCVLEDRVRYYTEYSEGYLKEGNWNNKGKWINSPSHASCIYYFGLNKHKFIELFQEWGYIFSFNY